MHVQVEMISRRPNQRSGRATLQVSNPVHSSAAASLRASERKRTIKTHPPTHPGSESDPPAAQSGNSSAAGDLGPKSHTCVCEYLQCTLSLFLWLNPICYFSLQRNGCTDLAQGAAATWAACVDLSLRSAGNAHS